MVDQTSITPHPALDFETPDHSGLLASAMARGDLDRPVVLGKFLFAGNEKIYVRGVTYGTFRPDEHGEEYDRVKVEHDFAAMARNGINTVRVYTPPPMWLLDSALRHDLRVMVGLPWWHHFSSLESRKVARSIVQRVRQSVRDCAAHPAILCFTIGNEIPSTIVRWHGARRIESFLERLAKAVKREDPGALVTYVNFPSTEYLRLDFVDFVSFNVYLESPDRLTSYLARLQNLAGDKPLLMAEIGLDSRRNGVDAQASALDWQIRSVFEAGCAGAIVFSWTDEWHRGGQDIEDWDFGLVDRERRSKPALAAVRDAYKAVPFGERRDWPKMSVIVCSYNGSRTIAGCLEGLSRVDYPDYEVIVVDDGSTDNLAEIAGAFDVRLIRTENQGLSAARNEGLRAATGEILAYLDDDARPDPHWLAYLAAMYRRTDCVAIGGPNIAPDGDGLIATAVAHAPGGPVHVLLTDTEADHLPGCNLTIRKVALEAIGGFDPRYRAAGDDVDVCWRLLANGGTLGFHPGAMVWHHRRNSVQMYWRQQQGYGKAEALLEEKWPERYNAMGHLSWRGRLYGNGLTRTLTTGRRRIYQGTWGSALFQSVYQPAPGLVASLPLMPEWWLVVTVLTGLALLGFAWAPLAWVWPLVILSAITPLAQAVMSAAREPLAHSGSNRGTLLRTRSLVAYLHVIQPLARLLGRIRFGLTPWRLPQASTFSAPGTKVMSVLSEDWRAPEAWLEHLMVRVRSGRVVVTSGGDFDPWDLCVRGGVLGSARVLLAIEEHGGGKQLARFRIGPRLSGIGGAFLVSALVLTLFAALDRAWIAVALLGIVVVTLIWRFMLETGQASGAVTRALREAP